MNIFVTSPDPIESACFLDIKRKNKMLVESAQMLSTAIFYYGGVAPYKPTHINHPCNFWVRQSYANWWWLWKHANSMAEDYHKRTQKHHKTEDILSKLLTLSYTFIPDGDLTPFVNCTAHFKNEKDIFKAYRLELGWKWGNDKRIPQFDTF